MIDEKAIFLAPFFYLLGSIPYAFIFTYFFRKKIIFKEGTRNVGVANTFQIAGLLPGFLTVVGEISKSVIPILIAYFPFNKNFTLALLFTYASLLGTNFSIFLMGRGGMGSTIIIYSLALFSLFDLSSLWTILTMGAVFFLAFIITRDSTWTNRIAYGSLPFLAFAYSRNFYFAGWGLLVAILYIAKYRKSRDESAMGKASGRGFGQILRKQNELIYPLTKKSSRFGIGGKAEKLLFLAENNFLIPRTYVVPYYAFDEYNKGNEEIIKKLQNEIEEKIEVDNCCFSIRSSANIEDSANYSFAGQFRSYLNVVGIQDIIDKVILIWKSFDTKLSESYINGITDNLEKPRMGVIIQEMVDPEFSGVLFTKNPLTGLDETIIEFVAGLGDKLVQGTITPKRWIKKWGKWIEKSEDDDEKEKILDELVTRAKVISKKSKKPLDIEWAYDSEQIYWLQIREITTLKNNKLYSNKISREFLPGIIYPLIWSVNIPVVNTSWKNLFRELIGFPARKIDIVNLARSFYYRAYFNMGVMGDIFELLGMPRELLEILAGIEVLESDKPRFKPSGKTFRFLPRMLFFVVRKYFYSNSIKRYLKKYSKKLKSISEIKINSLDNETIFQKIDTLFKLNIQGSYVVIVSQLLNSLYNMLLNRQLLKEKIDFDSIEISDVYQQLPNIDPRTRLSKLNQLYLDLSYDNQLIIQNTSFIEITQKLNTEKFVIELLEFFNKFGHFRDSGNDFSEPTWIETPEIVINMIINYIEPKKKKEKSDKVIKFKKSRTRFFYKRTKQFLKYREEVNYLYQYGYGLFRPFFIELSYRLKKLGIINSSDEIFYLKYSELKALIKDNELKAVMKEKIKTRMVEIEKYKNIILPDLIFDDEPPEPLSVDLNKEDYSGIPTSKGSYTGKAKIITGRKDFAKVDFGDIIIIPFSDVSWTPLFAKAKAVISESGGMLSHCSIVAREYKIPAVVSVKNAMQIKNNSILAVDGFNGKITIVDNKEEK